MSEPFNDLKQVELAIEAAEQLVGSSTMNMNPEQRYAAGDALEQAKRRYQEAIATRTGTDDPFLMDCRKKIATLEHQLTEANE